VTPVAVAVRIRREPALRRAHVAADAAGGEARHLLTFAVSAGTASLGGESKTAELHLTVDFGADGAAAVRARDALNAGGLASCWARWRLVPFSIPEKEPGGAPSLYPSGAARSRMLVRRDILDADAAWLEIEAASEPPDDRAKETE